MQIPVGNAYCKNLITSNFKAIKTPIVIQYSITHNALVDNKHLYKRIKGRGRLTFLNRLINTLVANSEQIRKNMNTNYKLQII